MSDFNPNEPRDVPDHLWGTYVPHSTGKNRQDWKTHKALKDVDNRGYGKITVYKRDSKDSEWYEIVTFDRDHPIPCHDNVCYVCKEPFESPTWSWHYWSPDADFEKVRVYGSSCGIKLKPRKG